MSVSPHGTFYLIAVIYVERPNRNHQLSHGREHVRALETHERLIWVSIWHTIWNSCLIAYPLSSTISIFNVVRRSLAILHLQERVNYRQGGSKLKMDAVVAGRSRSQRWFRGLKWYMKTPEYRLQQAFRWFSIHFCARGLLCRSSKNLELRFLVMKCTRKDLINNYAELISQQVFTYCICRKTCASVARYIIHCQSSFIHISIKCS